MKVIFSFTIVIVTLCLVPEIWAQNEKRDAKAIAMVKNLKVSRLDKRLPAVGFLQWFGNVFGKSQRIKWEVNDCGEQDGSGRQKDLPICVQALVPSVDRIEVTVMVVVGTHKRGVVGKPAVWGIWVQPKNKESKEMNELSDLVEELTRLKGINV